MHDVLTGVGVDAVDSDEHCVASATRPTCVRKGIIQDQNHLIINIVDTRLSLSGELPIFRCQRMVASGHPGSLDTGIRLQLLCLEAWQCSTNNFRHNIDAGLREPRPKQTANSHGYLCVRCWAFTCESLVTSDMLCAGTLQRES